MPIFSIGMASGFQGSGIVFRLEPGNRSNDIFVAELPRNGPETAASCGPSAVGESRTSTIHGRFTCNLLPSTCDQRLISSHHHPVAPTRRDPEGEMIPRTIWRFVKRSLKAAFASAHKAFAAIAPPPY